MKLRKTVTNDRSAPRLEHTTPSSTNLPLRPHATAEKGKKKGTVNCNTAGNAAIVQNSSTNSYTHLDLTGNDKTRGLPPKPLKIGGERQLSNAKDVHKLSPKIVPGQKQRLFHKGSTTHDQVQSPKRTSGDTPNEVTGEDTVNAFGATASKENLNPARKFFNSLRSKKSMANLSKAPDITTVPDTSDLFFSLPSKGLSRKQSKANVKDTAMDTLPSFFDRPPIPIIPASQPTDPVSHRTTPSSRTANPVYGLATTNIARKPPQSLDTAYHSNEGPEALINGTASAKADSPSPNEDANYDDDESSEDDYMSPEAEMGSSSMLPPNLEQEENPDFVDDNHAVRQLTNLHVQNVFEINSTRDLLSPEDLAALDVGTTTGSDGAADPGEGDVNFTRVETTTGPTASITDAARKMLEMSIAIDDLHAAAEAAEAADANTAGRYDRSQATATEEQKKNYSAGMVIPPLLSCFDQSY